MDSARRGLGAITLKEFEVVNTSSPIFTTKKFSAKDFAKKIKIKIVKKSGHELEFDLIGTDPSLPNAFRRILISEVPTMAIEKVHIYNNTSIIQDVVFAHRLGLIPLKADPRKFIWKAADSDDQGTEKDTLEFELKVKCKRPEYVKASKDENLVDRCVYSKHIRWLPKGDQTDWVGDAPGPVESDILLNKMLPGHELDMKLYAYKGIGKDHAKFSPVATAFYRLLPVIRLNRTVEGEAAERLQKCFSPGVIELTAGGIAKVADARNDGGSRNIYRHDDLKDAVTLEKVRDHFIFTIESTGAMEPEDLFVQSVTILEEKCDHFLKELDSAIVGS